jgi:hypothetical protein
MDDQDLPVDPALGVIWTEMDPAERLLYRVYEGEQPPPELRGAVREMYDERREV